MMMIDHMVTGGCNSVYSQRAALSVALSSAVAFCFRFNTAFW